MISRYRTTAAVLFCIGLALCLSGCQSFKSQSLNAEGVRRMNSGDSQRAEDMFLRARSANPADADACYNLAILEHQRAKSCGNPDNFNRAEEYYRLALDRNPSHVDAYRGLATLYCDENRPDDAFALLENWNRQELGSVEPKIELARLYNEYNRVDQAEASLRQALAMDPQNVRALNSMAYVYEQKQMYAEASAMYCKSLQVLPTQTAINQRRAMLDQSMGGCATGVCDTGACQTQLACASPAPVQTCAPAPACQTCAPSPVSYAYNGAICGPQPKPLDPPGWAITPASCVPQVAASTLRGNNSCVPTPAQTAQSASYSPSVANQAEDPKQNATAEKQSESNSILSDSEPALPDQNSALTEQEPAIPEVEPSLSEPVVTNPEPAAPEPVATNPAPKKYLPGIPTPPSVASEKTELY